MTRKVVRATVLALLEDDEPFYARLCSEGVLPYDEDALEEGHLELACVARTLVNELDVNWEGVDIVLRLREELIASRHQVAELLALLQEARGGPRRRSGR